MNFLYFKIHWVIYKACEIYIITLSYYGAIYIRSKVSLDSGQFLRDLRYELFIF